MTMLAYTDSVESGGIADGEFRDPFGGEFV